MFSKKESQQEDQQLQIRRDEFTTQMRKNHREEIISKRRNINSTVDQQKISNKIDIEQNTKEAFAAQLEDLLKKTYTENDFMGLVEKINSKDPLQMHEGIIGIRKLLSVEQFSPIQPVIDANLVPKMIEFIKTQKYPRLQMEATWALTNVASGTTLQCQSIIDKGGIPLFIRLLESSNIQIAEQAIWAIGNIAGDTVFNRDLIIKAGGLKPLMNLIESSQDRNIVKQGAWALSNLCRGNPVPKFDLVKQTIGTFGRVIGGGLIDEIDVITDCCWALSYLSDGPKAYYKKIIETGVIQSLVSYMRCLNPGLIVPCLRIIGNIVSGSVEQTNQVLKYNVISVLESLLENEKKVIRKQACWTLSNIAAGDLTQVVLIVKNQKLVRKLVQMLEADINDVKIQIFWLISNLSERLMPNDFVIFIRIYSLMKVFADVLRNASEPKLLEVALDTLFATFEVAQDIKGQNKNPLVEEFNSHNTVEVLEKLQYHKEQKIYDRVVRILQAFYQIEEPLS